MSARLKEYISIAVMLALTGFFYVLTPAEVESGGSIFPVVIMGLMLCLIALKGISDFLNPKSREANKNIDLAARANLPRFWIILLSIAAYVIAVDYIGFYVSSFIFFFCLTAGVQYEKRTPRGLLIRFTVVTLFMIFLYVLFTKILLASLPKGIFF